MTGQYAMWNIAVVTFVLTVAAGDVRWRKIPRGFTTAGFAAGLMFHLVTGGFWALLTALAAALLGFAVGIVFFRLGAIGGGDVKLIVALGAMLGLKPWVFAMEVAVFTAALIGLVQAVRKGVLLQTITNIGQALRWVASTGAQAHPVINVGNTAMLRAPFGVAAAVGTVLAVIRL